VISIVVGDTGISANGWQSGRTILALTSANQSSEDATYSQIDMIRCGYSGNHITVVNIVKSQGGNATASTSFSVSSEGNIVFNSSISNARGIFILSK